MCKFVKGRGLWKFNCSLLKIKDYLISINNIIEKEKMNYALPVYNPVFISNLPDECINFSITDKKHLVKKRVHWLKKLSFWRAKPM